jgi:glycopeptide antibiotics resistance protein
MVHLFTAHGEFSYAAAHVISGDVLLPIFLIIAILHTIQLARHRTLLMKVVLWWGFYAYLAILLTLTILPIFWFGADSPVYRYGFGQQRLTELNPFSWVTYRRIQIVGNVALFIPLTLLGEYLWPRLRSFGGSLMAALGASLVIETIQLVMGYFYLGNRSFDTGDILLNTVGGLLGFAIFKLATRWWTPSWV